jgi:hypothetical protein
MDTNEIKKEIKQLRKLKLQCKVGSKERIDLHRQIKDLKNKMIDQNQSTPEKDKLIEEILKTELEYTKKLFDKTYYNKFSLEQLKKYLENKIKKENERI